MPADPRHDTRQTAAARWRNLSRRGFLAALIEAGSLAAALGLVGRARGAGLQSALAIAPAPASADEPLTDHQLETLTALGYVLLPSTFSAQEATAGRTIADIVTRHLLRVPAAGPAFRDAAALLDEASLAQHAVAFAQVAPGHRRQLVADLLTPYTSRRLFTRPYYALTPQGDRIRRLWSDVSQPILLGFYNSAEGWRVVGYTRRPGQCSNLVDYQFPPVQS